MPRWFVPSSPPEESADGANAETRAHASQASWQQELLTVPVSLLWGPLLAFVSLDQFAL